ncbi:hypothetical protein AB6A40_003789 [Gnathostoma spinigerum]|uniref:Phospholipase A2 n=1 Tax=Gnathostoma spinigerum TaxID=75299 RepID=A0ABD6EBQ7_9BILA
MHLVVLIVALSFALSEANKIPNALWNFNSMASCRLNVSGLTYNNYGCYCGYGGRGQPVDSIDRCCFYHDICYGNAIDCGQCSKWYQLYIGNYAWECINGKPTCKASNNACLMTICECDREAVECWAQHPIPKSKPRCPS